MSTELRVLLIEDCEDDAALLVRELRSGGYEPAWKRVETAAALRGALAQQEWDLITCDYVLPQLGAPAALTLIQEMHVDVPVLIVSGEVGEEIAVEVMKAGALDFVSKHRLARLIPAVERELREVEVRRARRRAEEALRAREEQFRILVQQSKDAIFQVDLKGHVVFGSPACRALLGYEPEELIADSTLAWRIVHPDCRAQLKAFVQHYRGHGEFPEQLQEWASIRKDGQVVHVETSWVNLRDPEGKVIAFQSIARDVTARKRGEEERLRLTAAVEQSAEFIVVTDVGGLIVYVNRAFELVTGQARADMIGQLAWRFFLESPVLSGELFKEIGSSLSSTGSWSGHVTGNYQDGRRFEIEAVVSAVRDGSGKTIYVLSSGRDVTHPRQVEAQLRQAQKLEALGRLAGGVAHDFNNQLTVIKGYVQLLLGKLPPEDSRRIDAEQINATVNKSTRLVRQLLAFGRRSPFEVSPLSLTVLVRDMEPILRPLLGEQIALHVRATEPCWLVRGDRSQLEQVVMNLVANAHDAIVESGQRTANDAVTVETANLAPESVADEIHGVAVEPGPYVMLAVSDNGPGIAPQVREHLFEPFFTTKERGKGTGLGLASVFGIVQQHRGYITCVSEQGKGASFRLYFPRDGDGCLPAVHGAPDEGMRAGEERMPRQKTVLVVEDEPAVREMLVRALEGDGYRVHSAANAEEAWGREAAQSGSLDLLVTDVVMPGESGVTLAQRLVRDHPTLRVMFVSGYLADSFDLSLVPGARLVSKPFDLSALLAVVRALVADVA